MTKPKFGEVFTYRGHEDRVMFVSFDMPTVKTRTMPVIWVLLGDRYGRGRGAVVSCNSTFGPLSWRRVEEDA